ncbi:DUF4037 domain-containing protein [Bifidobacterium tsurumiense]|uniref:DUF4037 domain-containing protein n=3 Tax=Bifidobacterium tsurumiense TaxID=356829 RepID=UPI0012B256C2|nr:DUF4037 domain-containing protein [Bifidobacterium tsurumiense]MSS12286.1 DUF4037 domain-containing protein [Bifidobacterium tsurumiense]
MQMFDATESDTPGTNQQSTFDVQVFLQGLDSIFSSHEAAEKAEPYLLQALTDAENAGDNAGLLTVLNETMGFYRSQGRHDDNQWIIQRAIELALRMGLEGTEAWTTTLINAATGMRAAQRYDQAEDLYRQALQSAQSTFGAKDRRLAALHNNLSMLYSETGRLDKAQRELETALRILHASSVDALSDIDIASSHTNLALVLVERAHPHVHPSQASDTAEEHGELAQPAATQASALLKEAMSHASTALDIYRHGHLEHSAHFASALAGYAQVCFASQQYDQAVQLYRQSLDAIAECYGPDTDYYRITAANLEEAKQASKRAHQQRSEAQRDSTRQPSSQSSSTQPSSSQSSSSQSSSIQPLTSQRTSSPQSSFQQHSTSDAIDPTNESRRNDESNAPGAEATTQVALQGLELSRAFWQAYGKPLIENRYPEFQGRIAAGLIGHGSECYGFDDEYSQDHDFGPGFCLWLTDEDYATIGGQLQEDYDRLPSHFMGYGPRSSTARAQGASRRVGVFATSDFFSGITGYAKAPRADKPHEWLLLDEATLATATNGEVFADPYGQVLKTRQGFKNMPDDVRLSLISRRLGMMAQAGQYNFPRMVQRGDGAAAWISVHEFVQATASLVFLINNPITVGYLPYYKWQFAALRSLSNRIATRLAGVCARLEDILRLSSAACFGGAGFGEGGKGADPAQRQINEHIASICKAVVVELQREGLTASSEDFLEWQRPYVEEHIAASDACLHSL